MQLFSIIYLSKGIEPLSLAMKDSSLHDDIRSHAYYFSGETGDKSLIIPLIVDLENETEGIRTEAVVALCKLKDPKAIPALGNALHKDKSVNVREKAAEALGKIGDPKVVDTLGKALINDKSKKVRIKTAQALGYIGNKKAIETLNLKLSSETDEEVKMAIRYVLVETDLQRDIPIFERQVFCLGDR